MRVKQALYKIGYTVVHHVKCTPKSFVIFNNLLIIIVKNAVFGFLNFMTFPVWLIYLGPLNHLFRAIFCSFAIFAAGKPSSSADGIRGMCELWTHWFAVLYHFSPRSRFSTFQAPNNLQLSFIIWNTLWNWPS